jgi:4Fe-4S single cluster domain of Ferredoxin I
VQKFHAMANIKKRFPENVTGEFFVDSSCIDCETCQQLAPETFDDAGDHAFVYAQPHNAAVALSRARPVGLPDGIAWHGTSEQR